MAARQQTKTNRNIISRNAYINGAAAPQYEPEKIREAKREYLERSKSAVEEKVLSKRLSSRNFSKKQIAVFALCTLAVLCMASFYIVMTSRVHTMERRVDRMRLQYNELLKENELTRNGIEASVDYAEVYRTAVEDLGMQVPQKNQMIVYDRPGNEYVVKVAGNAK